MAKKFAVQWGIGAALLSAAAMMAQAPQPQTARLTIDPAVSVHAVSPTLYGMMTEEINHAFDGGLYAEQLSNRTFRPSWQGIEQWNLVRHGDAQASFAPDATTGPSAALPYSAKLTVTSAAAGSAAGVVNSGYWGIAVKPHTLYHGSLYAKVDSDAIGSLRVRLIHDDTGAVLAEATVGLHAGPWSKYEYTLTTGDVAASTGNHLEMTVEHPGTLWMQVASLMPPTYDNTPNGNRPDLMKMMAEMHPTFLRLPGGNYLEGDHLRDWYDWKKTIGPLVDRPGHQAPWTYWSTDGLGLLEFLEWCQDLHIEPVLAVYAGYSLQQEHVTPGPDLQPYVQSALDEVQYLTGDTSTKWGAERAKDGHPAPFPLHYIEIGNEDFFDKSGSYPARFAQFAVALHKAYPQYKLIATMPVTETDPAAQPDVVDDHYYKPWGEMLDFTHHYDDAPRTGPKVFVGEWATLAGSPTPNFGGALSDAAWMTSLERNSDLIVMAAYAPLLVNVNPGASQWGTNLIGYNAGEAYGSPSYYAQAMFAGHLGDEWPKSSLEGAGPRFYYSATVDTAKHVLHLKLVNASNVAQPLKIDIAGLTGARAAKVITLHGATYEATNTMEQKTEIHPVDSKATVSGKWEHTVAPLTIEVIDIGLR